MSDKNCLLVAGLKGAERATVLRHIDNSTLLLKMMEKKLLEELSKLELKVDNNFEEGWQFKQAYNMGLKKGLTRVLEYVKI